MAQQFPKLDCMRALGWWLSLLLLLPAWSVAGDLPIATADSYPLSRSFDFLEDKTGKLGIEDVSSPANAARFRPVNSSGPASNFGFTSSAIWLRLSLHPAAAAPPRWLLEVAYPPLDKLELYTPSAAGYRKQVAGDLLPFSSRPISHRNHVLPVTLVPGTPATLYIRLECEGTVSAPATLWRPEAFWRHDQASYAALGLYFGLAAGLLLYNLLLFVSVRDPAYLVYVLFVGCLAVALGAIDGLAYQFLWPQQLWWNSRSPPAATAMAAIFGLLFARTFLSSAARTPVIDKLLLVQIAGWVLTVVAALAASYTVATFMVSGLAIVTVITLMVAGIIGLKHGYPGARNFLVAWTVLLLGVLVLALHNMGALPSNTLTVHSVLIGSAFEMVLLSFALADRINVSRRFKQQAQTRIAAEQAMVQALSVSQEQLRTSLQEREIILDNSIVGIAFLTPKGRFRWANPAMLEILGAQGKHIESMERFYPSREQYLEVGHAVADHVRGGKVYETEMQIRQWDGTLIWISLSGKGVVVENRVRGSVWVIMDITRRKQLEEDLRASLARSQEKAGWT
jgi:PAS domain S-box-containing protein